MSCPSQSEEEKKVVVGSDCVSEYEVRECEGTDILRTEPCGGQCGQDYALLQGACVDWWDSWECEGERISKHRPCQGECYQDYQEGLRLLLAGECLPEYLVTTCAGQLQTTEQPCQGQCSQGRVLLGGKCHWRDEAYKCDGKIIERNVICFGCGDPPSPPTWRDEVEDIVYKVGLTTFTSSVWLLIFSTRFLWVKIVWRRA